MTADNASCTDTRIETFVAHSWHTKSHNSQKLLPSDRTATSCLFWGLTKIMYISGRYFLAKLYAIVYTEDMGEGVYRILQTPEYSEWVDGQPPRSRVQINKRLSAIRFDAHFGDHKSVSFYEKGMLKDAIWELRLNDGRRIYYAYIPEMKILLLLGGNKNGQSRDISKAKNIYLKSTLH